MNIFVWKTSMKITSTDTVKWYSLRTEEREKIPVIYGGKSHYINSTAIQLLIKTVFWHRQCTPAPLKRKPIALFSKYFTKRLWMGCKNLYTIRLKTLPKICWSLKTIPNKSLNKAGIMTHGRLDPILVIAAIIGFLTNFYNSFPHFAFCRGVVSLDRRNAHLITPHWLPQGRRTCASFAFFVGHLWVLYDRANKPQQIAPISEKEFWFFIENGIYCLVLALMRPTKCFICISAVNKAVLNNKMFLLTDINTFYFK